MNLRETVNAILHYQNYEYMPVVSFGYWVETLQKWAQEGHISQEEVEGYTTLGDNSQADRSIMDRLGFDLTGAVVREAAQVYIHLLSASCWNNRKMEAKSSGMNRD